MVYAREFMALFMQKEYLMLIQARNEFHAVILSISSGKKGVTFNQNI